MLEVGRILRAHGLSGYVVVDLWTDRTERLAPGAVLETERGTLTVVSAAPHQTHHLVRFAEITDRTSAESHRGTVLRAERIEVEGAVWVDQLFGARVFTSDGLERGVVVEVEANPASDLLVLDTGALVPLAFVVEVVAHERVVVEVPEGIFE